MTEEICYRCKDQKIPNPVISGLSYRCFDCDMLFCKTCIMAHCNEMCAVYIYSSGVSLECNRCGMREEIERNLAEIVDSHMRKFIHTHRFCNKV